MNFEEYLKLAIEDENINLIGILVEKYRTEGIEAVESLLSSYNPENKDKSQFFTPLVEKCQELMETANEEEKNIYEAIIDFCQAQPKDEYDFLNGGSSKFKVFFAGKSLECWKNLDPAYRVKFLDCIENYLSSEHDEIALVDVKTLYSFNSGITVRRRKYARFNRIIFYRVPADRCVVILGMFKRTGNALDYSKFIPVDKKLDSIEESRKAFLNGTLSLDNEHYSVVKEIKKFLFRVNKNEYPTSLEIKDILPETTLSTGDDSITDVSALTKLDDEVIEDGVKIAESSENTVVETGMKVLSSEEDIPKSKVRKSKRNNRTGIPDVMWLSRFDVAKVFYDKYGHLNFDEVTECAELGYLNMKMWLDEQKKLFQRGLLSKQQCEKLKEIGISFETPSKEDEKIEVLTLEVTEEDAKSEKSPAIVLPNDSFFDERSVINAINDITLVEPLRLLSVEELNSLDEGFIDDFTIVYNYKKETGTIDIHDKNFNIGENAGKVNNIIKKWNKKKNKFNEVKRKLIDELCMSLKEEELAKSVVLAEESTDGDFSLVSQSFDDVRGAILGETEEESTQSLETLGNEFISDCDDYHILAKKMNILTFINNMSDDKIKQINAVLNCDFSDDYSPKETLLMLINNVSDEHLDQVLKILDNVYSNDVPTVHDGKSIS